MLQSQSAGVEGGRLDWPQLHFQGQGTLLKAKCMLRKWGAEAHSPQQQSRNSSLFGG